MTYYHYSNKPVKLVPVVQGERRIGKPSGLWISDDDDYGWAQWCEEASFSLGKIKHEVVLKPDANILRITTAEELLRFSEEFAVDEGYGVVDMPPASWVKVIELYQGIIISPYQWSLRLDNRVNWYYGWDCASGCIWDISAIESIQPCESLLTKETK